MASNTKNTQEQGGNLWKVNGVLKVGSEGQIQITDTVTGTVYNITIENGVVTPVEV